MNIEIYDWAGTALRNSPLGYSHQQWIDGDLDKATEITKELFNAGLNVMWGHCTSPDHMTIFVDNKLFSQR